MSPQPWRVELGFAVASIVAEDGTVVAQNLTPEDAKAIVAALAVVEAARDVLPSYAGKCEHGTDCERGCYEEVPIEYAEERRFISALAAYDEVTR